MCIERWYFKEASKFNKIAWKIKSLVKEVEKNLWLHKIEIQSCDWIVGSGKINDIENEYHLIYISFILDWWVKIKRNCW